MIETSPTLPTLLWLDRAWIELHGQEEAARRIRESNGQGILLEWGEDPLGLFSLLELAARVRCPLLPARWMPARPEANGGFGDASKILWLARTDTALQGLLTGVKLCDDELDGVARMQEPLALLGVPGDVLRSSTSFEDEGIRRRAQKWIGRLGADRVALAVIRREGDPLEGLAREWGLPVLRLKAADEEEGSHAREPRGLAPILCTDFQLDREYRLPDDTYVPTLGDLLRRGSLLRERCLYESLPANWRELASRELELLNEWMLGPLLRRAGALIQTLLPVAGVEVEAPLPQVGGICAWLLGLSDRRLVRQARVPDPEATATALARALADWDRRLTARVAEEAWPRLQGRLLPWLEGGLLAACPEAPSSAGRRFCFSGRALWARLPLLRDRDGIPCVRLLEADRRALGWFELELQSAAMPSRLVSSDEAGASGQVHELHSSAFAVPRQLELGLRVERLG